MLGGWRCVCVWGGGGLGVALGSQGEGAEII